MGTGKTFIAAAAAYMAGFKRVLVLCPPHLVPKWKREVEMTVPGARAVIVKSITDLERLRFSIGSGPLFAVMSREKAKLSYRWKAAVIERWAVSRGRLVRDEETGEPFRVPCCPGRTAQVVDKDGVPLTDEDLNRRKRNCAGCGSPLWQADKSGPARYPLADYVKHRMRGFFDLLIGDEIHEFKSRGSAQDIAAGILADVCGRSLSLSGTLMGGYASTLFHLLYTFSPAIRTEFGRSDEHRWIQRYGFEEHSIGKPDDDAVEDGRYSRRRKYRKVVRERPGLVPSALFHLIGNTVFLRLSDVAAGLPPYEEQVMLSSMDSTADRDGILPAQSLQPRLRGAAKGTGGGAEEGIEAAAGHLPANAPRLPGRLHTRRDGIRPQERKHHRAGASPVGGKALPQGESPPRPRGGGEDGGEKGAGLRHPHRNQGRHGEDGRLPYAARLPGGGDEGRRGGPEPQGGVGRRQGQEGVDVLICHPRLVQTGLDLVDFPTICWPETDYSVYTMRQASRRSWRIGQTRPVKVVFMSYRNSLQADALKLVARKLQSSLAVEGELPEDGLAAYGDDGGDIMMALARKIVNGEKQDEAETVEAVFAQARAAEAVAEELLVDEGWKAVEVEPTVVETHRNGNGHAANGVEASVELVMGNGHAAVPVNGNGHHDGAPETQQSLFSWAEFMAKELVKPKARSRKPKGSSPSLFDWALSLEQEREEELVGAGR